MALRWKPLEQRAEYLPEPEENYLKRNLHDEPGPARAPAEAPVRNSSDMVQEYRLVIAIDYGTTFTGQ